MGESKEKVEKMLKTDSTEHQNWVEKVTEATRNATDVPERVRKFTALAEARFKEIQSHGDDSPELQERVKSVIKPGKEAAIKYVTDLIEAKIEDDIEFAIKRYQAKLEKLKEVTDSMLESGESFEKTIDNAMNILRKKITKITMSTQSANVVSENKDSPQQFLTKYQDISNELIKGLDNLKNSAETFLATEQ